MIAALFFLALAVGVGGGFVGWRLAILTDAIYELVDGLNLHDEDEAPADAPVANIDALDLSNLKPLAPAMPPMSFYVADNGAVICMCPDCMPSTKH